VGLEFAQVTYKKGAISAKFDVKCDSGTMLIDISPPLGETREGIAMAISTSENLFRSDVDDKVKHSIDPMKDFLDMRTITMNLA